MELTNQRSGVVGCVTILDFEVSSSMLGGILEVVENYNLVLLQ